jgi:hypothetical protein
MKPSDPNSTADDYGSRQSTYSTALFGPSRLRLTPGRLYGLVPDSERLYDFLNRLAALKSIGR